MIAELVDRQLAAASECEGPVTVELLGSAAELRSNSRPALRWATTWLAPAVVPPQVEPAVRVHALYLPEPIHLEGLSSADAEPIPLHYGKRGLSWALDDGRRVIRELGRGDVYEVDAERNRVWYVGTSGSRDAERDPARLLRKILLSLKLAQGFLPLHASAAVTDGKGIAFVGDKGAGKTTLLLRLIEQRDAAYLGNDLVLVHANELGNLWMYSVPYPCRVGFGTLRSIPRLRPCLTVYHHQDALLKDLDELWHDEQKIEFAPTEIASLIGSDLVAEAPLDYIVLPSIGSGDRPAEIAPLGPDDATVLDHLLVHEGAFPNWLDLGFRDGASWTEAMRRTAAALGEASAMRAFGAPEHLVGAVLAAMAQPRVEAGANEMGALESARG